MRAMNPLPIPVLRELAARFGQFMIIGAHARDRIVHELAGLELSRATRDLDLAIAVPSMLEFRALTQGLQPVGVTAMSFLVQGFRVDLIPFGGIETNGGPVLETSDGILTDVTGMAEAYATADTITTDQVAYRAPTLQAMIVLKTVAWLMRRAGTDKDATDLAMLLDAVSQGDYETRCFNDLNLLGRFDADPDQVGAYLTGKDVAADLARAWPACLPAWNGEHTASLLNAMRDRHGIRERQLHALTQGLTSVR